MPSFFKVKEYFQKLQLSGSYSVLWYNYRHVFIKLSNEFDYATVRRRPLVDFDEEHRMRVLKWSPNFSPSKDSSVVPVWISFPFLPNHLYNKEALRILAKSLGNPLQMDESTANGSRPSHPRICIEFDCLKLPPEQIFVHLRNKNTGQNTDGFWQKVIFEKVPSYCTHCHILGHDMVTCKMLSQNLKSKAKKMEEEKISTKAKVEKTSVSQQPEENTSERQKDTDTAPFLTDNWEIGNRKKGKEEAPLRERETYQGKMPQVITNNTFSALNISSLDGQVDVDYNLEKEKCFKDELLILEEQSVSEKLNLSQVCATNREASIPGSSSLVVDCLLSEADKKQDAILEKKGGAYIPESENNKESSKAEDLILVEDVSEEEESEAQASLPAKLVANWPERAGGSGLEKQSVVSPYPVTTLSEQGQDGLDFSDVGVAQEKPAEGGIVVAGDVASGNLQKNFEYKIRIG